MSAPTAAHMAKLSRLRGETVDRILERAAIIAEACSVSWLEADARAYALEAPGQRGLPGVR